MPELRLNTGVRGRRRRMAALWITTSGGPVRAGRVAVATGGIDPQDGARPASRL